jgi:hypothetical protein
MSSFAALSFQTFSGIGTGSVRLGIGAEDVVEHDVVATAPSITPTADFHKGCARAGRAPSFRRRAGLFSRLHWKRPLVYNEPGADRRRARPGRGGNHEQGLPALRVAIRSPLGIPVEVKAHSYSLSIGAKIDL